MLMFLLMLIGNVKTIQGQQTQKEFVEMDQSTDIFKAIPPPKKQGTKNKKSLLKTCFVHHLTFRVKCLYL